ncbi:hypothetical protein [Microbispora rosea]|uniref:hypothetical protein n=1 Tax=Microbispora rosea TaxID=58117 RepID=UPI0004C397F2|nr:hypothetical protein [Microbispora rosea]
MGLFSKDDDKYIVDIASDRGKTKSPTEALTSGPIMVHGKADLKRRQEEARKAGVELTVRKL